MAKPPPSILLALLLGSLLVIFAIGAAFALRLPNLGIDVDVGPKGQLVIVSIKQPDQPIALPATLIAISSAQGPPERIVLENDHHLIVETQIAPKTSSIRDQDRLAAIARNGSVILEMRDARGQVINMQRATTGYNALSARFWWLSLAGLTCAFISVWVFVLRPSLLAAQAICLIGVALLGVSLPIAVSFAGDFIVGGTFWLWTQAINYVATQCFAAALIILFCQYPQRLTSAKQSLWILLFLFLLPTGLIAFLWPDARAMFDYLNIIVLLDLLTIIAAAVFQWRATKFDPVGRSYIQLIGAAWVIVLAVWISISLVPVFLGRVPPFDFSVSMWLMVPPFFAMAYGVAKGFMFEASTWAGRLLLSATTVLALIGVDLGLIYAFGLDNGGAASGALFIVGAAWLLGRNALISSFLGKSSASTTNLFDQAVGVAMAMDDSERAAKWKAVLKANFEPLDMQFQPQDGLAVGVAGGGVSLNVPALRFAPPIVLTSKRAGTQVFTKADAKTVETLATMCARIDFDRDAYDRGTQAERGRIARDLHDDVSSRLLTSLHRTQPERVQADVREALSDIRSIISGLDGERQEFDDVMSAIRIEALDRFEAANIQATWPLDSDALPITIALDYRTYRNLSAVMREIASNIIRHAQATRVDITTQLSTVTVRQVCHISICDNGIGLAPEHKKGNGLTNIVARMAEIGGSVTFTNGTCAPEPKGLCIKLELPLSPL
jgi:two-component system, NarL family, sensor histidine kinase DevS